jgi:hypothetical protein
VSDCLPGRVTSTGPLNINVQKSGADKFPHINGANGGGYNFDSAVLSPEEVLFKLAHKSKARVSVGDEQRKLYFANERNLPDDGENVLPDSDLLKAVHTYSSRFYEAMGKRDEGQSFVGGRLVDERSMDETALLAMGILLEEAAREVIKRGGDLVFTEGIAEVDGREVYVGIKDGEGLGKRTYSKQRRRKGRLRAEESTEGSEAAVETE